jgi:hypothetical protein
MRYEGRVALRAGGDPGNGLLSMMRWSIGYGEWPVGKALSGECEGGWAAFGPWTSGNQGILPVASGQQIPWW